MIDTAYPYGEPFQRKLLSLLVHDPAQTSSIIKPHYFSSPMLVDIARVVTEIHRQHPTDQLTRTTVNEFVKASLSRKAKQNWPSYKEEIRAAFRSSPSDKAVLLEKAREFAKDYCYRDALVMAEKSITAGKYEKVHDLFENTRKAFSIEEHWQNNWYHLPHPSDYPFLECEWLIEGLIPKGAVIALSGEEGVGKTMFALAIAKSLTEDMDFLGRGVLRNLVLYLGLDVSRVTLQNYIKMMRWNPNGDFRFLTMWTGEDKQPPMLDDPKEMEKLYALAAKYQPLIIFDTLRDFFEGEENSSTDTKPVLDAIRKLRSLGATVLFLTHPPKSGNSSIRGTGNISQKVDIPYLMEKSNIRGRKICVLTCPTKNRFGSTNFRLPMKRIFIRTPGGPYLKIIETTEDSKSEGKSQLKEFQHKIVQYVKDHPGTNQKAVTEALSLGDRTVRSALYAAEEEGLLRSARGSRKEHLWSYIGSKKREQN